MQIRDSDGIGVQ